MLRQMHNFPWEHYILQKKGISPDAYFNPDLFWLSINSVYFSTQAINLAKSIKNSKYFVKKFKDQMFINGFDNLTEQQKMIKKANFQANFDDYITAFRNIIIQCQGKNNQVQQKPQNINQKQNLLQVEQQLEGNQNFNQLQNVCDNAEVLNPIDSLLNQVTGLYQQNRQKTQKSFMTTIKRMKKNLNKGKQCEVLRMMKLNNNQSDDEDENDKGEQQEEKEQSRWTISTKQVYSYHQEGILNQMKRLSQQDNQNNVLVDSIAQKPCSTQFLELLQKKTRQASIGKTGRYGLYLKRQKKAAQHRKASQRVNLPLLNTFDNQTNSCFQLSSKQYNQNSRSMPTQKTYNQRSAPPYYQQQDGENSHQDNKPQKTIMEDVVCQICNDGDYDDYNLIVFCAGCNITVHQQCYGIIQVPIEDWICERCKFQREYPEHSQQNLTTNCPLCPKSNGPMKPTVLLKNSDNNQNFEQDAINLQSKVAKSRKKVDDMKRSENRQVDYFKEFDITKVKWMHLSCALFVPEIGFLDEMIKQPIIGFDNLDLKRFKLQCSICGTKDGACIQCPKGKCQVGFHVECARRANYFMEIEKTGKDITYTIYCEKHRPLLVKKNLQSMEKRQTTHVMQFCKVLYKANNQILKYECLPKSKKDKIMEKQRAQKARQEKQRMKRKSRLKYDLNSDDDDEDDDNNQLDQQEDEEQSEQMKDSMQGGDTNQLLSDQDDIYSGFKKKKNKKNSRRKKNVHVQNDKKFLKDDERKLLNRIRIYAKQCAKLTISLRKIKVKRQAFHQKVSIPLPSPRRQFDDAINKRKSKRLQQKSHIGEVFFDQESQKFNFKQKKVDEDQVVNPVQQIIEGQQEEESDRKVGDITKSNGEVLGGEVQEEDVLENSNQTEEVEKQVIEPLPEQQSKVTAYQFTSTSIRQEKRSENDFYYKTNQLISKVDYLYILSDFFPWDLVAFDDYTAKDCYQKFNRLIPNDILYQKEIMKKRNVMKASGKYHELLQRSHPYCKCQKIRANYQGSWIECSGKNCPAFNWMHIDCIGLDFLQDEDILKLGNYYCDLCRKKEKKSSNFPRRQKDFVNKLFESARRRSQQIKIAAAKPLNQNIFNISREYQPNIENSMRKVSDIKVEVFEGKGSVKQVVQQQVKDVNQQCEDIQQTKEESNENNQNKLNEHGSQKIDVEDEDEDIYENKKQMVVISDQQEQEQEGEGNEGQESEQQQYDDQQEQQQQQQQQQDELSTQEIKRKLMAKSDGIDSQNNMVTGTQDEFGSFYIKIKVGQKAETEQQT